MINEELKTLVPIRRMNKTNPLPTYAHEGDGGMDLYSTEFKTILAGERALVGTGIAIAIPLGYAGFIVPRSGMALKHGISIVNAPGLIDSAYRGEIKVILLNTGTDAYSVQSGDRIAQLVIKKVETVEWEEVEDLDEVDRGGGFGHTGR